MSATNQAAQYFYDHYKRVSRNSAHIPFSKEWENSTGYLDHAVKLVKLDPGQTAVSLTEETDNFESEADRKVIFVGTRFGTCVVFEREALAKPERIVCNLPDEVRALFMTSTLLEPTDVLLLLGGEGMSNNVGKRIERLLEPS